MRVLVKPLVMFCATAVAMAFAACGSDSSSTSKTASTTAKAKKGGSLTVLEDSAFAGAWPAGLDPATNTNGAANQLHELDLRSALQA